ncbi:small proline-rich protein 2D-like [Cephus cinctus]|uniref:Small proline-rich protein 2D-like n=1 Tax=Cephus cinctus TaxID=211228 RepID=A0AAJ7RBG7_CEPCN|nr:small proline-rich protein 2D-like [Cephus cinctus]
MSCQACNSTPSCSSRMLAAPPPCPAGPCCPRPCPPSAQCTVTVPPAPIPPPKVYVPKRPCCRPGCFHKPRPLCCRYLYWRLPCKAHCFEVW